MKKIVTLCLCAMLVLGLFGCGKGSLEDFLPEYLDQYDATKNIGYISIPTGNHDMPRISLGRTQSELEVAYAFIMTMPGIPFVYCAYGFGNPTEWDAKIEECSQLPEVLKTI